MQIGVAGAALGDVTAIESEMTSLLKG